MTTMEDLTKTQIVLLTLLVSFIASIATGIITSTLLAQAPQNVTQTIDRVIEHTVQSGSSPTNTNTTVKEVTVIKESDAVVSSIEQGNKSTVRIKLLQGDGTYGFYAIGVIVSKSGLIVTDKRSINQGSTYTVFFPDGTSLPATVTAVSDTGSLALMTLQTDSVKLSSLIPVTLSKLDPKLGQTVIALEGKDKNAIAVGRVLSLDVNAGSAQTDIPAPAETQGGPLLNLQGELVGLKTSNADLTIPGGSYTVVSPIARFIAAHS